ASFAVPFSKTDASLLALIPAQQLLPHLSRRVRGPVSGASLRAFSQLTQAPGARQGFSRLRIHLRADSGTLSTDVFPLVQRGAASTAPAAPGQACCDTSEAKLVSSCLLRSESACASPRKVISRSFSVNDGADARDCKDPGRDRD